MCIAFGLFFYFFLLLQWSTYPDVLGMQFMWDGYYKQVGSSVIGSSPEFDFAMYSLCYITRPGKQWVNLHVWQHLTVHVSVLISVVYPSTSGVIWAWEGRSSLFKLTPGIIPSMVMGRSSLARPFLQPLRDWNGSLSIKQITASVSLNISEI